MSKVGSLVKYIREDSEGQKSTGFYPPIGTVGRIIEEGMEEGITYYKIKWPEGTTTAGGGYVDEADVEKVVTCGGWLLAGMFDDFAKCPHCGQHEHSLFEATNWTFCPYCGERIKYEDGSK